MKDKNEEQKYIESLVTLGKKIALEASQDKELEKRIIKKNEDIEKVENIFDISNLKKMKGFDNFYRIII